MNDPFAPIQGISLERYAELGAEVADHVDDPEAQAKIVEGLGVSRADWEAAQSGWTARMRDMALMGIVAQRFMPLYQAALTKKKGTVDVSYDDWIALNGAVRAYGYERALATYQLDSATWTQLSSAWQGRIAANASMAQTFHGTVEVEAQRLRGGGQHRPITLQRQSGAQAAGEGPVAAQQAPATPQAAARQYENQMLAASVQANNAAVMAQANAQAAAAYGNAANQVGFLGRGVLGAIGMGAIAKGIGPGMQALVAWSDGNKYPAQVVQVQNGQVLVAFQNGQQQWVPESAVSRA